MSALAIFQALVLPLGVGLGIAAVEGSRLLENRRMERQARRDFESGDFDRAVDEAVEQMKRGEPGAADLFDRWAVETKAAERARFGGAS